VLSGSGLSSSAAFEVMLCAVINHLFNDGAVSAVEQAQIAQFADCAYFGKPCGLLDQTTSAVGGFVTIDFKRPQSPAIRQVNFDLAASGYALCITDTGGNHADLTDEYAAVREEMEAAAGVLGQRVLRELEPEAFLKELSAVREKARGGDRAVLRALHFFGENNRVDAQVAALEGGDLDTFFALVKQSGRSSYMYNQNVYAARQPKCQPVALARALSELLLKGRGAFRVHGGGFAGTVQAFVPQELLADYIAGMEAVFGAGLCHVLSVRSKGGVQVL
jgi:galactokinase